MKIFVKVEDGKTEQMDYNQARELLIELNQCVLVAVFDQILPGEYTTIDKITLFRHK